MIPFDPFRPTSEPARFLYEAFQAEAAYRKGRTVEEWMQAEVNAVHRAALEAAERHDLRAPTIEEVRCAEACARGHADYGAQWSYSLIRKLNAPQGRPVGIPQEKRVLAK